MPRSSAAVGCAVATFDLDRGFYSKELMLTLTKINYPYLIFVPKNSKIRDELDEMKKNERKTMQHKFKLNINETVIKGETTLALLKQT